MFDDVTEGPRTAMRSARADRSATGFSAIYKDIITLIHEVRPSGTEWRGLCGLPFLSYETDWHPRQVTCLWCVARRTCYTMGY